MFFHHNYATPGPGVKKDAPPKTGPARFLEIIQLECGSLFKLNLLFLLSCIPIITIPPALFAMNQVIRRMVCDQPVDCFYHYRTAFRRYWKRGYLAFLLTALPLVLSGGGAFFYLRYAEQNYVFFLPFVLCSTVFLVVLLSSTYLYGLLGAGLEWKRAVKLSGVLGVGRPARAVLAALSCWGLLTATVLAFPISGLYALIWGVTLPVLLSNFFVRVELAHYCAIDSAEEEEEALRKETDALPEQVHE